MFDLVKVAIRNVGRNKRRSMITIFTVFIGVVVASGTRGLLSGLQGEIKSALARKMHGDLQIHKAKYQDSIDTSPFKVMFEYNEALKNRILSTQGIRAAAPRIRAMGLLNHQKSQSTLPVMIQGIESAGELAVCPRLGQAVVDGRLFDSSLEISAAAVADDNLEEAAGLDEQKKRGSKPAIAAAKAAATHRIAVTPTLMRGMNASLGDEVVIVVQDKNNMQQALIASIVGVIEFGLPGAQSRMIWMDFRTLQERLALTNEVSEIALLADSQNDPGQVKDRLKAAVGPGHEVETYLELSGLFRDAIMLQNMIFGIVVMVVFLIVISAIVNTSLMTVMERTREIGTLMALGYKRIHILALFLVEAAVIGLTGGAAGLATAFGLISLAGWRGIDFALPGQNIKTVLYPFVPASFLLLALALSMASALVASFLPAYRASRMKPVEALSKN